MPLVPRPLSLKFEAISDCSMRGRARGWPALVVGEDQLTLEKSLLDIKRAAVPFLPLTSFHHGPRNQYLFTNLYGKTPLLWHIQDQSWEGGFASVLRKSLCTHGKCWIVERTLINCPSC